MVDLMFSCYFILGIRLSFLISLRHNDSFHHSKRHFLFKYTLKVGPALRTLANIFFIYSL